MKRRITILYVLLLCVLLFCGCSVKKVEKEKIRDLEYTVLEDKEIPEILKNEIDTKKADDFKLSYREGEALYIVRGFGMQETGGYSIQMRELYLSDNAIFFGADLIGPGSDDVIEKTVSYPYIVVKTERLEENVVFE